MTEQEVVSETEPDENARLDDYGDGSKPKDSRWKFYAVFLGIVLIAVIMLYVFARQ